MEDQSLRRPDLPEYRYLRDADPEFLKVYETWVERSLGLDGHGDTGHGLPPKYRELVVSAVLAMRGAPARGIAAHLARALSSGLTEAEAREGMIAASVPGGAPTLLTGLRALMLALEELEAPASQ